MMLFLLCLHWLRKLWDHRWDGSPSLPYYTAEELNLKEERFYFMDGKYRIDGSRYFKKDGPFKALVCVFHGIGAGRNSYMKEISRLCEEGYLVYAYDNLGCMRSEGKEIKSLGRVYDTQKKFFSWLEKDERAKGLNRYAFGHSWGGYQAMLSLQNEYRIEKCVSLAGIISPSQAVLARSKGLLKKIGKPAIKLTNLVLGGMNSNIDVRPIIKKSQGKLLYIVGDIDPLVPPVYHGDILNRELNHDKFVYKIIKGSKHSVMYTHESEAYLGGLLKKGITEINCPPEIKMDISKATESNEEVMQAIFDFFSE